MVETLLAVVGTALVLIVLGDAIFTTLTLQGSGPLTDRVSSWAWRSMLLLAHRSLGRTALSRVGPMLLLVPLLVWLLLLWMGWMLIFSVEPGSVVNSQTGEPADVVARLYFTAYNLVTLGLGDYRPQGGLWQLLTAIASISGFFLLTLSISYLVPVLSAAVENRQLALWISTMGSTPQQILIRAWNGKNFKRLSDHVPQLTLKLLLASERHLAYPVLHFFHSGDIEASLAVNAFRLDDALTLLEAGIEAAAQPPLADYQPLRLALDNYLKTTSTTVTPKASAAPDPLSLAPLRMAGIPTTDDAAFRRRTEDLRERRQRLLGLCEKHGWCFGVETFNWPTAPQKHRAQQPTV